MLIMTKKNFKISIMTSF